MSRRFNLSVVDTMLHDSRDLVIHRTKIWAQESLAFLGAAV